MNGIRWILTKRAPWRDLPEGYGKWQTVSTRFYRWQKAGVWNQILEHLQAMPAAGYAYADQQENLDWQVHDVDGTVVRAHQHAAGGKKGAKKMKN